eukprot:1320600-Prorocentrum_lima.AAC.1
MTDRNPKSSERVVPWTIGWLSRRSVVVIQRDVWDHVLTISMGSCSKIVLLDGYSAKVLPTRAPRRSQ